MAERSAGFDQGTTSDAPDSLGGGGVSSPSLLIRIAWIPLRRWRLTLGCVLVSAVVAFVIGEIFSKPNWKAEGTLLYTGLPMSEEQRKLYNQPKLESLMELVKSENVLEKLGKEFDLAIPTSTLKRIFKVERTNESETISVALEWQEADRGAAMVNELMKLFIDHVATLRKDTLDTSIEGSARNLAQIRERLKQAEDEHKAFLDQEKITVPDIKTEMEKVNSDLATQRREKETLQKEYDIIVNQLQEAENIQRQIEIRMAEKKDTEPPDAVFAGDKEYVTQKKNLEREIDVQKKLLLSLEKEYPNVKAEFDRGKKLLQNNAIARAEVEKLETQEKKLAQEIANVKQNIKKFEKDLGEMPRQFALFKITTLKEKQKELGLKLKDFDKNRSERVAYVQQLAVALRKEEPMLKKSKDIDAERLKAEGSLAELRLLRAVRINEFIVERQAVPTFYPFSTDRKKLSMIAFAIPLVLLLGLMIAQEMSATVWNAETVAHKLGLPILARSALMSPAERAAGKVPTISQSEARALALRIRQYVPDSGAIIMFSSLNEGNEVDHLVADASRYLAMRDERILILDARIANTQLEGLPKLVDRPVMVAPEASASLADMSLSDPSSAPLSGLVQYLVFEGQKSADFILPTKTRSVDYMPAGGPYPVTDVIASQQMKDLLESVRKKYTLTFIVGPAVSKNIDTEILAAYVYGMVVILNGSVNSFSSEAEQFVRSLKEANAPLLGSIICV